jgi:hypothetical protein
VPNITATSPDVGGTVESQRRPIAAANRRTPTVVTGSSTNSAITTDRRK